ncbi:MAG: addiction module toxin, HicA family [Armatimonadetes bacterium CG07_land_8_20_14_0_80_59_28]|nr:MAG: addiction module toxin, HicA family [Armatimonadetes bacterium CG07_land_8_20_14_0_80_59_28]PIX40025.1 MAG: addiction module toxin, HicA family [Armatimonadetes bacterium CG_4_8_14_3_um_filter_58_9]PJB65929.1 MAG: addiction module toxin, HicA family [Armatimonadetes bacterium CG_4_9_14_3_um_filter_58_7]
MKRNDLLRHRRRHGCFLKLEGAAHSLWASPTTGRIETVPRHRKIPDRLATKICRSLSVPDPK